VSYWLDTDVPHEGYLHASIAIQKLRCIVRKLLSKRKFNSHGVPVYAAKEPVEALAMAVGACSAKFPSLLTPQRGFVMVIADATGSDDALRGGGPRRTMTRLASLYWLER
jgi:hypothetical protein